MEEHRLIRQGISQEDDHDPMIPPPVTTFSIITPSFNQGTFIRETIESVLGQEGHFNLDYIVVDGGSTDNSAEIIRHYESLIDERKWPVRCLGIRYRWISEKDRGQTDAIVKGFGMAEGTILSWLNSDDTLLSGALSTVMERFLEAPSTGIVYGKVRYVDGESRVVGEVDTGPTDHERLAVLNEICQPGAFFRRSEYDAAGGLDPSLQYVMDHDLWIRITLRGAPAFLPEFLASYRLHGESKTAAQRHAVAFQRETVGILLRHFAWAPLNRVYACCNARVRSGFLKGVPGAAWLAISPTLFWTLWEYLRLNRGVNVEDLRMIRPDNLRKILRGGTSPPAGG
jgi:glycosyltransferase involved in cell wall biosynthesis